MNRTPLVPLCCDNLGELNGTLAREIVNAAINEAVKDLDERAPYDGKAREVNIKITLKLRPPSAPGEMPQVATKVAASAKVPPRHTAETVHEVREREGKTELMFSLHAPENPRQTTLHDLENDAE